MPVPVKPMSNEKPVLPEPFGFRFFAEAPASFVVAPQTPVPANYRLGPGDKLQIRFWTATVPEVSGETVISRAGVITLSNMGDLPATGLTLEEFRGRLGKRLRELYKNPHYAVDLVEPRSFVVFVTGAALRPGQYTVSALSNLFNVIYAAGGPTLQGSMRAISLRRKGQVIATTDLYRFLMEGVNEADLALQDQDVISFPLAGPRVAVQGEVPRPAVYELRENSCVTDALALAGGAGAFAYQRILGLLRVEEGRRVERTLDWSTIAANPKGPGNVVLRDGDVLTISAVFDQVRQRVAVRGNVEHEGTYSLLRTPTAKALLTEAQVREGAHWKRADLLRTLTDGTLVVIPLPLGELVNGKAQDVTLVDQDQVVVYEADEKQIVPLVSIEGPVKHAATYRLAEGMRVRDLIFASGGLQPEALVGDARLEHLLPNGRRELIRVDLKAAMEAKADGGPELKANDRLTVFENTALEVRRDWVLVEGAVRTPGSQARPEGLCVRDALMFSGGLQPDALATDAHLYRRLGPDQFQIIRFSPKDALAGVTEANLALQDEDRIVVYNEREARFRPTKVRIVGEVQRPDEYPIYDGMMLYDLLLQAGGPTDTAGDVVEVARPVGDGTGENQVETTSHSMREGMAGEFRNVRLVAGMLVSVPGRSDRIREPKRVELKGEVARPGVYALLNRDETLGSLLKRAGNFTDKADPFGMALVREKDELLSEATASQIKVVLDTLDQLLPSLPAQGTKKSGDPSSALLNVEGTSMVPDIPGVASGKNNSETVLLVSPRRLTETPVSDRITFNMEDRANYVTRIEKMRLADGDVITIPRKSEVVHVLGAVQSPGPVLYDPGYSVAEYLKRVGGGTQDADYSRAVVIKVSGTTFPLKEVKMVDPGDVIVIASKPQVVREFNKKGIGDMIGDMLGLALVLRVFL